MKIWGAIAVVLVGCTGDAGTDPGTSDAAGGNGDGGNNSGDGGMMIDAMVVIPGGTGEPANMMGMTLYHNQVRAMVQTATPLPFLTWNNQLAATAAAWIAQCQNTDAYPNILDHNPGRSTGHPYYVGENIFASGGTATPQAAVSSWAAEQANFNYPTCMPNKVCGHYTQLVWRTTLEVGCAIGNCASIPYGSTIVCNYGPGGNSGGAPY